MIFHDCQNYDYSYRSFQREAQASTAGEKREEENSEGGKETVAELLTSELCVFQCVVANLSWDFEISWDMQNILCKT